MPRYSKIQNKTMTSISIDRKKLDEVRKRGINLSLFVDEALTREFEPDSEEAFNKAVAIQKKTYDNYIEETGQQRKFDDYKLGGDENVVEKEPQPENRQTSTGFEGI